MSKTTTPFEQLEPEPGPLPDNVCITDSGPAFQVVQDSIWGLWEVVNTLATVRPPRRERYRVTIFGSARMQPHSSLYQEVSWLASQLTVMGCDIITGGGPGLMQAANEGSVKADLDNLTDSIGIRVGLDFEQQPNPFVEKVYQHRTFFSRLHHFVLLSDAYVVVPGGIGTTLEALMIWQLLQVRKLNGTPLVMVGEMWKELTRWAERYMLKIETPMASATDFKIPHCVANCEEAIAILKRSKANWRQPC